MRFSFLYINDEGGVLVMEIKIRNRNPIREFFNKSHSQLEDIAFSIIQLIPERFLPQTLMEWMGRYLDKRLNELKQQTVKQNWKNVYLQKVVEEIHDSKKN